KSFTTLERIWGISGNYFLKEQEILHFFEKTIDSLEQSLEEDELRPQMQAFNNSVVDGASKSGPNCRSNPKDQDIIDLVRPKPDLVETKNTAFTPTNPESHFEVKPRSDPDSLPLTEYNPSLPDSHPVYHPPGSIPTPVLIAQKIAETQTGGSTVLSASSLLRRRSSEFDKSTSSNKQGPPTTTKPARYPANISVILGNREQQNSSLANINIEERRAQMLANLSGTTHPLLQEDLQQDQTETNSPTRSMSFRDPTPEKSRMEALSKLGLARNRASSGDSHRGSANRPSEGSSRTVKPPAPTPAPRPPRHSYHGPTAVPKPPQRALSPDNKRRTGSLFRPQGITVQFSGKGASEESRKEALKKLGLLKD
uniref:Proline and serine rich 2 n=1 Tax=Periophthalmus magnuspinnatus TaxID=409849 RepID=A0A3B3ZNX2_9GOBI